jgi:Fur family transcriptional regulator, iron response regulator
MNPDIVQKLREHDIQPSAQRLAVAAYVLGTEDHPSADHPSADQVWERVQASLPMLSRATVYNTLNLFVKKGLLKLLVLSEGNVVFDPKTERHHHFIDADSGRIHDVEWDAVSVGDVSKLKGYEVDEYMLVMRGRKKGAPRGGGLKANEKKRR